MNAARFRYNPRGGSRWDTKTLMALEESCKEPGHVGQKVLLPKFYQRNLRYVSTYHEQIVDHLVIQSFKKSCAR